MLTTNKLFVRVKPAPKPKLALDDDGLGAAASGGIVIHPEGHERHA